MNAHDAAAQGGEIYSFLIGIGWFPERRVEIEEDVAAWAQDGYTPSPRVQDYMSNCKGLSFEYPRHELVGGSHSCWISGVSSTKRIFPSLVRSYETRLGYELCPVGQAASGSLFMFMTTEGTVYGGKDSFLAKISDDGYHALHAIWTRVKLSPLP